MSTINWFLIANQLQVSAFKIQTLALIMESWKTEMKEKGNILKENLWGAFLETEIEFRAQP